MGRICHRKLERLAEERRFLDGTEAQYVFDEHRFNNRVPQILLPPRNVVTQRRGSRISAELQELVESPSKSLPALAEIPVIDSIAL